MMMGRYMKIKGDSRLQRRKIEDMSLWATIVRARLLSFIFLNLLLSSSISFLSCSGKQQEKAVEEDREAKALMQGVWVDAETEDVTFRVKGDTIFYADSTSMPAYFKIVGDSLALSSGTCYAIEKQTAHIFSFRNQNGDLITLNKLEGEEADSVLVADTTPKVMTYTHQVKKDSVVNYDGARYHWYIAINPTKYKVVLRTYNEDGMEVENVYYDNIMHVSIYNGAQRLYSSDFRKQQYAKMVPEKFLEEAVLANMEYTHADAAGLHFNATLCIPDGASCYLVENVISYKGQMTMKLLEY